MAKFISAGEAAGLIKDNDTVVFSPDSLVGFPNEIVFALRDRFLKEGHPANITTMRAAGMGNFRPDEWSENCLCIEGLLKRTISSYTSAASPILGEQVINEKIQGYMFPLGVILQLYYEVGRGMPGVLSKIGLGTFMDPRLDGGKCNKLTEKEGEDLVEYVPDFMGEDYLWYKSPGMNVALLRGTRADEHGNISTEKEPIDTEMLYVAQAVKASGGTVIVQVEESVPVNSIHPRMVKVPGIYVDYVVVAEDPDHVPSTPSRMTKAEFNKSFVGEEIVNLSAKTEPMELTHTKVIARRAAQEIIPGSKVNFGMGMPQFIPTILDEYGKKDIITMISETGAIGGIPASGRDFGCHWNIEAFSDHAAHFSFFDGGNLDIGFFGLSEMDKKGNVNTSHLNGVMTGVGGFTNIATTSKKAVFMGTFTAKGLKTEVGNGTLKIVQEGKFDKLIDQCAKWSFVGAEYLKTHDQILIITERCVLTLTKEGMILSEIAPGIDAESQIQAHCAVDLIIPEGGPKLMDPALFTENDFQL